MTKPDTTLIAMILDRSGSMKSVVDDTIGGFNTFVEEQKKVKSDDARLTLVQFDNHYEMVHRALPLSEVPPLTRDVYIPRGMTSLLDAMGKTINHIGRSLETMEEDDRPENVVVVTITDGDENSSREYSKKKIVEMIKHQTETYKWQFVFLGANIDAIKEGGELGITIATSMAYDSSAKGVRGMMGAVSDNVAKYRRMKTPDSLSFTEAQRQSSKETP